MILSGFDVVSWQEAEELRKGYIAAATRGYDCSYAFPNNNNNSIKYKTIF